MEPVRMAHPQHGFMHAYSTDEIERLQGYGWELEQRKEEVTQPEPKKRGRPRKVA